MLMPDRRHPTPNRCREWVWIGLSGERGSRRIAAVKLTLFGRARLGGHPVSQVDRVGVAFLLFGGPA